jgi:hypothetical protein
LALPGVLCSAYGGPTPMPAEQWTHEMKKEVALQQQQREQIDACYGPLLDEFDKVKLEGIKTESTFPPTGRPFGQPACASLQRLRRRSRLTSSGRKSTRWAPQSVSPDGFAALLSSSKPS